MKKIITTSAKQTFAVGKKFGARLTGGEVIALTGDLGAGKTVFTKGVAAGLGITKTIKSPTFILMSVYPVKKKLIKHLVHLDCYRIKKPSEIAALGFVEFTADRNTVTIIEWAERIKPLLPKPRIDITITHTTAEGRIITIR